MILSANFNQILRRASAREAGGTQIESADSIAPHAALLHSVLRRHDKLSMRSFTPFLLLCLVAISLVSPANATITQGTPLLISTDYPLNRSVGNLTAWNISTFNNESGNVTNIYTWYRNGVVMASLPNPTTESGLVAYYPLDGNTLDYAGNNDAANYGATYTSNGKVGGAYSYVYHAEPGNYIEIANSPEFSQTNEISLEAWVYANPGSSGSIILGKWVDGTEASWLLQIAPSSWGVRAYIPAALTTPRSTSSYGKSMPNSFSDQVWRHVSMVFNGSGAANADRLKIYLDGQQQALTFFNGAIPSALQVSTANVRIGGWDGTGFYMSGKIDEVAIYSRSLSASEIQGHYYGGLWSGTLINSSLLSREENWTVTVTPCEFSGCSASSGPFSVYINPNPYQGTPLIVSTDIYNRTIGNLTAYNQTTNDYTNDTDINLYAWFKNGILQAGIANNTTVVDTSLLSGGDVWTVQITPCNSVECGAPKNASILINPMNYLPNISAISVAQSPAYVTSVLSCNVTVVDGEQSTFNATYNWFKNGVNQTALAGTAYHLLNNTPALISNITPPTVKGDNWSCSATAYDGNLSSLLNYSANNTIANSAPYVTLQPITYNITGQPAFNVTAAVNDSDGAADIANATVSVSSGSCSQRSNATAINNFIATFLCTGTGGVKASVNLTFYDVSGGSATTDTINATYQVIETGGCANCGIHGSVDKSIYVSIDKGCVGEEMSVSYSTERSASVYTSISGPSGEQLFSGYVDSNSGQVRLFPGSQGTYRIYASAGGYLETAKTVSILCTRQEQQDEPPQAPPALAQPSTAAGSKALNNTTRDYSYLMERILEYTRQADILAPAHDVSNAYELLNRARAAYDNGDYVLTEVLLEQAKTELDNAKKKLRPINETNFTIATQPKNETSLDFLTGASIGFLSGLPLELVGSFLLLLLFLSLILYALSRRRGKWKSYDETSPKNSKGKNGTNGNVKK